MAGAAPSPGSAQGTRAALEAERDFLLASLDDLDAELAAGDITDQAIELAAEKAIKTIWMQLGVVNQRAATRARAAGLEVIMDRCPKIEFGRLNTELSWGGFNSRIISARRKRVVMQ